MSGLSGIGRLVRFINTVRYLRPVQVWGRLWFRLYRPRPQLSPPPPIRKAESRWHPCARASSMRGADEFHFLGETRRIATAADWNHPNWPKLWLYNAHYFDDLTAQDAASRVSWHEHLITRWIAENPPGQGNGWEPYPDSLRIVNWIKWERAGNRSSDEARHSLAVQTRWLRKKLEIHLLGNHLWANAKALVFAGAHFTGPEADQWLSKGLALIRRELDEQILDDGGHFERSPMYHAIVLEDVLDLIQLDSLFPQVFAEADTRFWRDVATRMLRWLAVMTHPDGRIALFNDAAFGIAPELETLRIHAAAMGVALESLPSDGVTALTDSGYVRLQNDAAVLIADVGDIGPDYLPGHAHADTLSFELSLHGEHVIVDAGTSRYDTSPERLWQRSTAGHNTLEIDGEDSSEVWSSFRVGRRAHVVSLSFGEDEQGAWLRASQNGYRRLPGSPLHCREWRLSANQLRIDDSIEGTFGQAIARLRIHPDYKAESAAASSGSIVRRDPRQASIAAKDIMAPIRWHSSVDTRIVDSTWHPCFGAADSCQVLQASFSSNRATIELTWN
jgi:uncharacterized heparinase superfamily protein